MARQSFVLTQDFKAPYVIATGMPHKPSRIMVKKYQKGEIIEGEMKTTNGKPTIVLIGGVIPVPVTVLKAVVTKEIISNATGTDNKVKQVPNPNVFVAKKANTRYVDAGILGAILGVGAVYLAEKQSWITVPDKKNKLYGAIGGALLAMYLVYRKK